MRIELIPRAPCTPDVQQAVDSGQYNSGKLDLLLLPLCLSNFMELGIITENVRELGEHRNLATVQQSREILCRLTSYKLCGGYWLYV
jgi:hypothetical protein